MPLPKEQTCKGCSLVVQPGYPKCPRCKMPMPAFENPLSTTQHKVGGQGGTALESESNKLWIVATIVLIAVITVVIVKTTGSSSDETVSSSEALVEPEVELEEIEPIAITPAEETDIGNETEQEDTEKIESQRQAISELEETLKRARLWTTIDISTDSDSVLSLVSGACEDETMKPTILKVAATLKAADFTAVQCIAKHGALLFELKL